MACRVASLPKFLRPNDPKKAILPGLRLPFSIIRIGALRCLRFSGICPQSGDRASQRDKPPGADAHISQPQEEIFGPGFRPPWAKLKTSGIRPDRLHPITAPKGRVAYRNREARPQIPLLVGVSSLMLQERVQVGFAQAGL